MERKLWLFAVISALLLSPAPVLAQDGFYVVAGRYTPGTKITSLPLTISAPGYYYLTRNLSHSGVGNGITVNADNVTIDLMGFALSGPANGSTYGIYTTKNNVEVRNGTITGWYFGVVQNSPGTGARAIGVRAVGNTYGIRLRGNALIKGCTASPGSITTGYGLGVDSGAISGCTVMNFSPSNSTVGQIYVGSGKASDNLVITCNGTAISSLGGASVMGNAVINCQNGFNLGTGGSLVGNTLRAVSGQTALLVDNSAVVADQNSFLLDLGANLSSGTGSGGFWALNAYSH